MVEWAYVAPERIEEPVSLIWNNDDLTLAQGSRYAAAQQEFIPAPLRRT